jgi:hypothetical protein
MQCSIACTDPSDPNEAKWAAFKTHRGLYSGLNWVVPAKAKTQLAKVGRKLGEDQMDRDRRESSAKAVLSNVHCAKARSVVAKAPRKDLRKHQVSIIMEYTNPFEHRSSAIATPVCLEWNLKNSVLPCHWPWTGLGELSGNERIVMSKCEASSRSGHRVRSCWFGMSNEWWWSVCGAWNVGHNEMNTMNTNESTWINIKWVKWGTCAELCLAPSMPSPDLCRDPDKDRWKQSIKVPKAAKPKKAWGTPKWGESTKHHAQWPSGPVATTMQIPQWFRQIDMIDNDRHRRSMTQHDAATTCPWHLIAIHEQP